MRFPRAMLNGPANERLLELLGVEIVDDLPADLEAAARDWLAGVDTRDKRNAPDAGDRCRWSDAEALSLALSLTLTLSLALSLTLPLRADAVKR
jgi:hypothetical protein